MFRKILIANDGSEGGRRALAAAIWLAKQFDAELHMISAEELPQFPTSIDEVVEEKKREDHVFQPLVEQGQAQARAQGLDLHGHIVFGHVVSTIVNFVEQQHFDLLVVGFMGHSALYNRLIGSTSDRLVEHAPCSVIVIK
jgi:nucleotide-binding universal stress UspA family protein